MSFDTKRNEITIDGVTYDVDREESRTSCKETLTILLDNEDVFPGLHAELGCEDYIEDYMNPRDCDGVLGVMVTEHRSYTFGGAGHGLDEDKAPDFEVECEVCDGEGTFDTDEILLGNIVTQDCSTCDGHGTKRVDPVTYFKAKYGARVVLKLGLIDHSGISMYVGGGAHIMDPGGWDSGTVGFYFDSEETRKACGCEDWTDECIRENLEQEIESYDSYLRGEVYYYYVQDEETGYDDGCGGYVGDRAYVEGECFSSLERAIEARLKEIQERAEMGARDITTEA